MRIGHLVGASDAVIRAAVNDAVADSRALTVQTLQQSKEQAKRSKAFWAAYHAELAFANRSRGQLQRRARERSEAGRS